MYAGIIDSNSEIGHIGIYNSHLPSKNRLAGMISEVVQGKAIVHGIFVRDVKVIDVATDKLSAGILTGNFSETARLYNIKVMQSSIVGFANRTEVAIGAGRSSISALLEGLTAIDCKVTASNELGIGGIGVGCAFDDP